MAGAHPLHERVAVDPTPSTDRFPGIDESRGSPGSVPPMTTTYTFDVFATLDGFGSYGPDGDWGGYWGKHGPEFLDRRLEVTREEQRMVLGATTFRFFMEIMGPTSGQLKDLDPVNDRMRSLPTTVVSSTLEGPQDWPDATVASGDAVEVVRRLKAESDVPLRSHGSLAMNRALLNA